MASILDLVSNGPIRSFIASMRKSSTSAPSAPSGGALVPGQMQFGMLPFVPARPPPSVTVAGGYRLEAPVQVTDIQKARPGGYRLTE